MKAWELLGEARTPDGTDIRLTRSGSEFLISANAKPLMSSRMHGSEEALATLACDEARGMNGPRVLVGGLGMGFTLRAVLDVLPADAVVTVHGTIGLEAAAAGVPVLLADRSYFSDWGVATVAQSRDDYLRLLGEVSHLPTPDATVRRRAQACFALALAGPPEDAHALRMTCDSRVSDAYREILQRLAKSRDDLAAEQRRIEEWLAQDEVDGFAAYHLLAAARRKQALVAQVTPA